MSPDPFESNPIIASSSDAHSEMGRSSTDSRAALQEVRRVSGAAMSGAVVAAGAMRGRVLGIAKKASAFKKSDGRDGA